MTKTRREFALEFKREAVALLESGGRPLTQVAAKLGIQPSMLALTQQSCHQPPLWSGEGVDAGSHIEFEAAVWVDVSPKQRGESVEVACC